MTLQQFKNYKVVSVEKDMRDDKKAADLTNLGRLYESLKTIVKYNDGFFKVPIV